MVAGTSCCVTTSSGPPPPVERAGRQAAQLAGGSGGERCSPTNVLDILKTDCDLLLWVAHHPKNRPFESDRVLLHGLLGEQYVAIVGDQVLCNLVEGVFCSLDQCLPCVHKLQAC